MNEASIIMVALEKPPKAVLISVIPKRTISRHARIGGAPNGSFSVMIKIIMNAVIAMAIIIGIVI
jgi:hypothetical protein